MAERLEAIWMTELSSGVKLLCVQLEGGGDQQAFMPGLDSSTTAGALRELADRIDRRVAERAMPAPPKRARRRVSGEPVEVDRG